MKHTLQDIKDMSNRSHSHADALATLYQMIMQEISASKKISRRKIRAAYSMTLDEYTLQHAGAKRPDPGRYLSGLALIESVFAAAGWTIVDDDRTELQPMATAPKDGTEIMALYDISAGPVWVLVKCPLLEPLRWVTTWEHANLDESRLLGWMPIPPLPENDK